ncbi:unnamed protein product, partial [marine sediment metagenome]
MDTILNEMLRDKKGQFVKGHKAIPLTEAGRKRMSEAKKGNIYS